MTVDTSQRVASRAIDDADRGADQREGDLVTSGRDRSPLGGRQLDLRTTVSRCGSDVIRLLDRPLPVLSTLFGCGFGSVRTRNRASVARLDPDHLAMRAGDDTVELSGPRGELETDLENWELAFLRMAVDGEDAIALSYDDRGRTNLEMVLDASDVESLAPELPTLEHDVQRPSNFLVSGSSQPASVQCDVEPDRLERHWTYRADYDYIRRLERGFRMERRQLFETLPCKWATRIGAKAVDDLIVDIGERAVPCFVETFSGGTRIGLDVDTLRATHRRRRLVADGAQGQFVFDPGRVASAFVVRKPCRRGLQTAVEFFGGRNHLQVRLRPVREAELHQRLVWRGCLPEGRLCADDA